MDNPDDILDAALEVELEGGQKGYTVRRYLTNLLLEVWKEGECFSGKRPFGDSGWEWDLYIPLVRAGFITGVVAEYGDVEVVGNEAHSFVTQLISRMCMKGS